VASRRQRLPGAMSGPGGAVRRARLRIGLSIEAFASRAGYAVSSVRGLEAQWWPMREKTVLRIARALDAPVAELGHVRRYRVDAERAIGHDRPQEIS
jgi:transcriptional regulator with XRE-family HTH domain